jgi:hypothetical protein
LAGIKIGWSGVFLLGEFKNPSSKLLTIKVVHTLIWAFFVLIILYILYSAIIDRIDILTWIAIALIVVEGIILLINGWRCPLTTLGENYTEQTDAGFDIFLPRWVAKNNKTIFTTIYFIGVIMVVYRLIT